MTVRNAMFYRVFRSPTKAHKMKQYYSFIIATRLKTYKQMITLKKKLAESTFGGVFYVFLFHFDIPHVLSNYLPLVENAIKSIKIGRF